MKPDFNQALEFYEKAAILGDREGKKKLKKNYLVLLTIKKKIFIDFLKNKKNYRDF